MDGAATVQRLDSTGKRANRFQPLGNREGRRVRGEIRKGASQETCRIGLCRIADGPSAVGVFCLSQKTAAARYGVPRLFYFIRKREVVCGKVYCKARSLADPDHAADIIHFFLPHASVSR
jgi:hypothetical protein